MNGRRTIVLLGMMTKMPVAGIVWLTVPYLVGLRRLGYDVYYVEAHARTPSMLMSSEYEDGSLRAAAFIDGVMRRFGFADRWGYHALHSDGRVYGMTRERLSELYREADLIVNLHGGTEPQPEHTRFDRLVLVETDPVEFEVELHDGDERAWQFYDAHCAHFSWGLNYGNPDCRVPLPDGVSFRPTRMPVLLDEWHADAPTRSVLTTVGNWEQNWREVTFEGDVYSWSKHHEFLKFVDLPSRTAQPIELALSSCPEDAHALLTERGWLVRSAAEVSVDVDVYRTYVTSSRGEFTVAKDQNVRLRSGWFSDRSAAYLAAGRPVITQDTGFGAALPLGEGLHAFSSMDDIVDAIDAVNGQYARQARGASEIAREYFDATRVLRDLVEEVGLPAFPPSLSLAPSSRSPTVLGAETLERIERTPPPEGPPAEAPPPELSVVVVTFNGLPYTRLCLETLLGDGLLGSFELIVVDNSSGDGTRDYLRHLAARDARVRPILNPTNDGFAAAVNRGVAAARGERVAILNNDTIPPRGTLARLSRLLDDPELGLVGPVTNHAANAAQVDVGYESYGGLLGAAARRAAEHGDTLFDIPVTTMFCVAVRRSVLDEVGPLDERFGAGLFEDDDYSLRVRAAGYRVVCAEGVLVHHIGEASFGDLVPSGAYAELFDTNRRRFEEKWQAPWEQHVHRRSAAYRDLVARVRRVVEQTLPPDAHVLVVSRGDAELLDLGGRQTSHFPQTNGGVYAGYYPASDDEAIAQLEELRAEGSEFIVFPATALWWLEHYSSLRAYLDQRCVRATADDDACVIYGLEAV